LRGKVGFHSKTRGRDFGDQRTTQFRRQPRHKEKGGGIKTLGRTRGGQGKKKRGVGKSPF